MARAGKPHPRLRRFTGEDLVLQDGVLKAKQDLNRVVPEHRVTQSVTQITERVAQIDKAIAELTSEKEILLESKQTKQTLLAQLRGPKDA